MRFDVLTLFPGVFPGYLGQSLLKLAIERGLVSIHLHDIRNWATGVHRTVDDRPFGGGPGMLMKVEPVVDAVEAVRQVATPAGRVVLLTPQGRRLTQEVVEQLALEPRLLLLCGRYEGFDDRVRQILIPDESSIGDFVLSGGEVAAMVVIDAVVRLVPGVLGDEQSNQQDSFSRGGRLLEFAQFTRPREYRGLKVPEVLLSGNHPEIARWRAEQSLLRTAERRGDLLPGGAGPSEVVSVPPSSATLAGRNPTQAAIDRGPRSSNSSEPATAGTSGEAPLRFTEKGTRDDAQDS